MLQLLLLSLFLLLFQLDASVPVSVAAIVTIGAGTVAANGTAVVGVVDGDVVTVAVAALLLQVVVLSLVSQLLLLLPMLWVVVMLSLLLLFAYIPRQRQAHGRGCS